MRPVYSVQFEIPGGERGAAAAAAAVRVRVWEWVTEWYRVRRRMNVVVPAGGVIEPAPSHRIEAVQNDLSNKSSLSILTWNYVSDSDQSLIWQSQCVVAASSDAVEVSVVIRVGSRENVIAPPAFDFWRPNIVATLAREFACSVGGHQADVSAQVIRKGDIREFVASVLLNDRRRLPVVLLSRDLFSEEYPTDPDRLADALVGLAAVYALADKWAGFELSDVAGKPLSCFGGAVKVYWPGLTAEARPGSMTLYMPDRIREAELAGRTFESVLLRRLASISAFRFAEGPVTREVRTWLAAEEGRQAAALREEVRAGRASKKQVEDELLLALDENERLAQENRTLRDGRQADQAQIDDLQLRVLELEEQNEQIEAKNKALVRNLAEIPAVRGETHASPGETTMEGDTEPRTVRSAVDVAARRWGDSVLVLDDARRSAERSPYARPEHVLRALLAIKEVGDKYLASRVEGRSLGTPLVNIFEQLGFKYAADESPTTKTKLRKSREFVVNGQKRYFGRHMTLGGGDRVNCLQIYFDFDETLNKTIIAYCGLHLQYASQTT